MTISHKPQLHRDLPKRRRRVSQRLQTLLSLEALANVAQETTLSRIATATERIADVPLVEQLREAGVLAPQTLADRAFSPLPDILSQGGLNLLSDFTNLQQRFDEGSIMGQDVDMSLVPGGTADNPAFVSLVNLQETQKVEVVGGSLDVTGKVDANVTNEVAVKQAGPFAVTQAGEFVVRLDSGPGTPGGRARRSYGCGRVQLGRSCGGFGYRECVSGFLWGAGYLRVERSVLR